MSNSFAAGAKLALAAGLGYVPLGIALGVLVEQSSLPWWVALGLSTLAYAGSLEFLLVGLMSQGASLLTVALATFFVNFRHVFYAFTFPLQAVKNPLLKLYAIHSLTDEAYAITAAFKNGPGKESTWRQSSVIGLNLTLQSLWVLGVMLGVLASSLIPGQIKGLEFALVAMFLVLALEAVKTLNQAASAVIAIICFFLAFNFFTHTLFWAMLLFVLALGFRYFLFKPVEHERK